MSQHLQRRISRSIGKLLDYLRTHGPSTCGNSVPKHGTLRRLLWLTNLLEPSPKVPQEKTRTERTVLLGEQSLHASVFSGREQLGSGHPEELKRIVEAEPLLGLRRATHLRDRFPPEP